MDPIAIVGMGLRFPGGCETKEAFWELLCGTTPAIRPIPEGRGWDASEYVSAEGKPGHTVTDRAGWVDGVDRFDPQAFKLSPKEAAEMDPQQRLVLECSYEALLDAYVNPASLAGSNTGVFVGAGIAEYMAMAFGDPENMTSHTMSGNSLAVIANRVSNIWDLRGPSLTTDTACSSAMTAFHLGCQALKTGDCDVAIVAGVNTLLGPSPFIGFTQAQMLSPTGTSRPFDEAANGFVRGEGCGVLILKRTSDLVSNLPGRVYAYVRGHGINEDGKTMSLTMPSEEAQYDLMANTIRNSKTAAEDIVYVEAHGTGTKVGDPIEAVSISRSTLGKRSAPLAMGSAKGHVGHLETAAGAVGLVKAALILYYGKIPPTAGFSSFPKSINASTLKLRVPITTEPLPVPETGGVPCTSINSYGFGGSNGYAILSQAKQPEQKALPTPQPVVLALSSHFAEGVEKAEATWKKSGIPTSLLPAACAVATAVRPPQRFRKVLVADAGADLSKAQTVSGERVGASPAVLFAFGGQGSQYPEMGRGLYEQFTAFRATIDRLVTKYKAASGIDLIQEHGFCQRDMSEESLASVLITVPCTVFVQCALVEVLREAGVPAAAAVGHSTGEIVAAYTAGCIDLDALVSVTHARASAQDAMQEGAMAAWAAPAAEVEVVIAKLGLQGKVCISCHNTATGTTLSGDKAAIAQMVQHGKEIEVRCTILPITRAYHSSHVDAVKDKFMALTTGAQAQAPTTCPLLSSTSGKRCTTPTDPEYWFGNMRGAVLFDKACTAVRGLAAQGVEPKVVLEVSPHAVLMPYLNENLKGMTYIPCLNKKRPAVSHLFTALATLFVNGVEIDWARVLRPILEAAAPLGDLGVLKPFWQHKDAIRSITWRNPYTHPQALARAGAAGAAPKAAVVATVGPAVVSGGNALLISPSKQAYLRDHIVDGECVLPGAFYVAACLQRGPMLQGCGFHRYLSLHEKFMSETASGGVLLNFHSDGPRLALCSNGDADANEHFSCVLPRFAPKPGARLFPGSMAELRAKFADEARVGGGDVNLTQAYSSLETFSGLKFGSAFRRINSLRVARHGCEALAAITPPEVEPGVDDVANAVHPAVLDAAFQALAFLHGLDADMFVPNAIGQTFLLRSAGNVREAAAHAVLRAESRDVVSGDIDVYDAASGEVVLMVRGLVLRRAPSAKSRMPRLYFTGLQPLRFQCPETPVPQDLDDLVPVIRSQLQTGRIVRVLGLPGSNTPMLQLAGRLALTDKQAAECPLRNNQLVMVSLDTTVEGPAVHRALDPSGLAQGMWDVLVCGSDADLHGDARTVMAQTYLSEGGVLCGETCWVKFIRNAAPAPVTVELVGDLGSAFPPEVQAARVDAAFVIDGRADVGLASALLKDLMAGNSEAALVCLIPLDDIKAADALQVRDRALALKGWSRCARNETGRTVVALQVPFPVSEAVAGAVLQLLARRLPDQELVWTEAGWQAPRMLPVTSTPQASEAAPDVRLQVGRPGQLSSLHWHPLYADYEDVRADEVQVQVKAISMHFKDVMLAMGMLGDFKPIIGMECAGTVTKIGAGITQFKVGDQVMCLAMSTSVGEERSALFGTKCIAKERQTVLMPQRDDLSFVEAAGFLGVMATAWHALVKVARLEKDDTVLIHSTLGGVGQAALQIARNLGCRIIGSAGNPDKRKTLLDMGCHMVMDSRNPSEFVEKVMEFTAGRGVDVVLNSLAGDGQAETLRCVAPCGRFVEIGKRDILMDKRVGLGALKENVTFFSVHLDLLDHTHPHKVRALIDECTAMLADGRLKPTPTQVFPADHVVDAFKLMASGKHQGKIVVEIPDNFRPSTLDHTTGLPRLPHTLFPAAGSVLVTGGTRGLGLELARWAADRGAMHLILLTGSGTVPQKSELLLKAIRSAHPGIVITTPACDVRNAAAVQQIFAQAQPPITSVFHAANQYSAEDSTTLASASLMGATWDIKVQGAVNLHEAALKTGSQLSIMVMFTSLAGLHGNKGQALYVAANAALHQLAAAMRNGPHATPAIALDFPIVVGAGRLADVRNGAELHINTGRGFGVVSFAKLETLLAKIMANPSSFPPHMTMDLPHSESPQAWAGYHSLNKNLMMFEHLCPALGLQGESEEEEDEAPAAAGSGQSAEEIEKAVLAKIAFVLGAGTDDLEMDVPMPEMGVDSLAAVELANWGQTTYGATVSQTEFLSGLTPRGFLNRVLESAAAAPAPAKKAAKPKKETPAPAAPAAAPVPVAAAAPVPAPVQTPAPAAAPAAKLPSASAVSSYQDPVDPPMRTAAAMPLASSTGGQFGERTIGLTETLNPKTLRDIVAAVKGERRALAQVLVFRGTGDSPHFCTGMDLKAATFGDDTMSEGLEEFARLHQALEEAKMPLIAVCHGATRGGGMLFPCHATVTLAVTGATFGFPEIRQGGLPGVVSVAAKKRLNPTTCKRWMCTGDAYTAEQAMAAGLVDFVGSPEEVDRELRRLLSRFRSLDAELLQSCYTKVPAGNVDQALLAMGALDKRDRVREREPDALVSLQRDPETGVCVLELNDPSHCNAIDWALANDLHRAIEKLKEMAQDLDENGLPLVRAVVFQGAGDHFCVGVNPYNFIRRTKVLPVITSGQITYEIYRAFVALRDIGCPVVAVVHGKVMGGGLAASLNADYRIAHESTLFNYGNLPRGVCPGLLLSHNLGMTVGHKNATDLYMNDVTCTAREALGMGLVNEVYETVELAKAKGFEFAARLASFPVTGVRNTLSLMRPPIDEQRLARECMGIARCNKVGNAFSGQWKAPERRVGMDGAKFGEASSKAKPAAVAPPKPSTVAVAAPAAGSPTPNYGAWPNWEEYLTRETAPLDSMTIAPLKDRPAGPTSVFLTGATGFLGAFIIRDLLAAGHRVSCLVRADDERTAMSRLKGNMNDYGLWQPDYEMDLKVYCGDLVSDDFGLSARDWAEIAQNHTTFVHNGADVNFSCQVEELLPCNVKGTRTALRLAATGGMYFCHVSSLSVFSLYHFVGDAQTKRPDPRILINGYARSKWLAEQVVWAAGERGMQVTVVRPGRIMGDSQTGACNLKDWFARYLLTCVQMQRAWNVDHQTDMTQVDSCSDLIVQAALQRFSPGACYHAVSLENLHTIDITSYMVSQGYKMDPVDYNWWMDRVKSLATSAMQPLLNTFAALPVKETDGQIMRFSSDMQHRNGSGLDQLERMVNWMRQKGFLPAPQHPAGSLPLPARTPKPAAASAAAPCATPLMPRMQSVTVSQPSPVPTAAQPAAAAMVAVAAGAQNAGIHAMELYTPNHMVDQAQMEQHHGCPGKYTAGLLQEQIGFCGDDEDAVSMALTVVARLMKRTGLSHDKIGRLEVGTESLLDRSKSIKTHLMTLFQEKGCYDIEGVDNYNACYGGTAAFLNTLAWLQSPAWDGRYGLVVCVDIADFADHQAFLNGASAVALLLGPDAPVVLERERASCMINSWDFYKPVGWKDAYPLMPDGKHSVDCYMACLDMCYRKLNEKVYQDKSGNLVEDNDYFVNHCTSTYLCKRAFKRVCENAYPKSEEVVEGIFGTVGPAGGMTIKLKEQQTLYETKAEPATWITKRVGSSYTASCYTNLYSLFATIGDAIVGKKIVVFSYGSGSASTMYRLRVDRMPTFDCNILQRLDQRVKHDPHSYIEMITAYTAATYGRYDFKPMDWGGKQEGVWYLTAVDELGKRFYQQHAVV